MRSHRLRFWALVLCFVLLIAYFVIPVFRADAAGGTVSPMSDETALATFGQSFPGTFKSSMNPVAFSATTFEYVGTYDMSIFKDPTSGMQNNVLPYYSNLGCKVLLYSADCSGLQGARTNDGYKYSVSCQIGATFQNVTTMKFVCGFSYGTSYGGYNTDFKAGLDVVNGESTPFVQSLQDGRYAYPLMSIGSTEQQNLHSFYSTITEYSYTGEATTISFVNSYGLADSLINNQDVYFYIICPVANDDVIVQGGGGSSGDTSDIYDYLSSTLHDMLQSNAGLLQSIYNFIVTIPDAIIDGLHDLFIPSQQDLEDFKADIDDLLHDTFGGLYDGFDLVHDNLDDLSATPQNTIRFPGISVAGFTLEAQDVPVKPAGFDALFDALALVVDIVVTFAFLNMCKRKLFKFLSPEGGGSE